MATKTKTTTTKPVNAEAVLAEWNALKVSELNRRGARLLDAVTRLRQMIQELQDDAPHLERKIRRLQKSGDNRVLLNDMLKLLPNATGLGWVLDLFETEVRGLLIPSGPTLD